MGFDNFDVTPIEEFCRELNVPYTVVPTLMERSSLKKEKKNPVPLCPYAPGRISRPAETGMQKTALGHNLDDTLETFFLSLFHEGRFNTFSPVTYLDRKDITVIRPLIYAPEPEIIGAVRRHNIPVVPSPCPAAGYTQREEMKTLLRSLAKKIPNIRNQMLTALKSKHNRNLWD